ncbi:MAG: glycosyltransferase family 2 protein [Polyangiaceae bacterium]
MAPLKKKRLLVFVIAYRAESTLQRVLERVPAKIFSEYDCEILVVDDASTDRTFEIGQEYKTAHPEIALTVLRNQFNQGYGGNQKVGYGYAVAEKFDFVAMVHGDGQYAPEELPRLLEPLRNGEADAVFGSRMMTRFGALKGGMPLYKFVGNKILTATQNAMLGTKLSEFHSGYRIYSVKALAAIPFRLNSNDFHFDTEIIVQLVNSRARIKELPIPTYYGDEICRVDGMKYAKDVLFATAQNSLHRAGLMYQRRFDVSDGEPANHLKLGFPSSHTFAVDAVPAGAKAVDIGGRVDGVARALKEKGVDVTVVRENKGEIGSGVRVLKQDLDEPLDVDVSEFSHLLLLDVLDHVKDPEKFVDDLRKQFDFTPRTAIITTGNVAFFIPRLMLLIGEFNQGRVGTLDRTHTRLFNRRRLEQLLIDAGFRIKSVRGVPAPVPLAIGDNMLSRAAIAINEALIRLSPGLFAYQIYIEAETTPNADFVLASARRGDGAKSINGRTHRGDSRTVN